MIVRRKDIRNPDYLIISSFVERLFLRELKTYVTHIRKLLAVTHYSVVLRSNNATLRAAFTQNVKNLQQIVESVKGLKLLACKESRGLRILHKLGKIIRSFFISIARKFKYIKFCSSIYKHQLRYTGQIGKYLTTKKMTAPTQEELSFLIENKYKMILHKRQYRIFALGNENDVGIPCLSKDKNYVFMLYLYAYKQQAQWPQLRAKIQHTVLAFVRNIVNANILKRNALCYTIFYRNWRYGFASLPIKRQLYTLLRSPHTDKKSREQFKYEYRRKIKSYPSFVSIMTKRYVADRLNVGLGVKSKQTQMIYL